MYITANRLELLAAAKDAERIAPANSPLDVMKCTFLATETGNSSWRRQIWKLQWNAGSL